MCFYLYSPGKQVEVTYLNESVKLDFTGSSKVSALFVFANKTVDEQLEELFLVYPNSFYDEWDNQLEEFKKPALYRNDTPILRDEKSPKHYPYTKDPRRALTWKNDEVIIRDLHPIQKDEQFEYKGSTAGTVSFEPYIPESIGFEGFKLLQKLGLTVFKFKFKPSIPHGGTYAIKVFFHPRRTVVTERSTLGSSILYWLRKNPLIFELMGPFDVVKLFEDKCSLISDPRPNLDLELWQAYAGIIKSEYIEKGFRAENTTTVFHDYRLQIAGTRWMSIFKMNILPTKEGQIRKCKPFPDFFFSEKGTAETVYQYFTGKEHIEDSPEEFSFRVVIHT